MDACEYFRSLAAGELLIVADDPGLVSAASPLGEVQLLAEAGLYTTSGRPVLVVPSRLETVALLYDRWDDSPSPLAHLSVARYNPSYEATRYAAGHLRSIDGAAAVGRRARRYEALFSCDDVEITSGASTLYVQCGPEPEIANMDRDVRPQWLQSVTEFLEASMVNIEGATSSFSVEGTLEFDGLSYLVNTAEVGELYGQAMGELMLQAARGGVNRVEFVDNRIRRLIVDGEDRTGLFADLYAGKERETAVTELGFGCARFAPDWTVNSPLHKCAEGVFVGVGMGHLLPHVDFVASRRR